MMELYKEHGVNPMGGCLPLLLQMPLLFAFWNMLSVSIELRRRPGFCGFRILSQHDPVLRHADPDGRLDVRYAENDADHAWIPLRQR